MLALGNRNSPGGHQRAVLPEHLQAQVASSSPQVLKGEGLAFLPPLLAIILWTPLIPVYPGLQLSDLGSILHRQQWFLMYQVLQWQVLKIHAALF